MTLREAAAPAKIEIKNHRRQHEGEHDEIRRRRLIETAAQPQAPNDHRQGYVGLARHQDRRHGQLAKAQQRHPQPGVNQRRPEQRQEDLAHDLPERQTADKRRFFQLGMNLRQRVIDDAGGEADPADGVDNNQNRQAAVERNHIAQKE